MCFSDNRVTMEIPGELAVKGNTKIDMRFDSGQFKAVKGVVLARNMPLPRKSHVFALSSIDFHFIDVAPITDFKHIVLKSPGIFTVGNKLIY